jgi:hypothetical protein
MSGRVFIPLFIAVLFLRAAGALSPEPELPRVLLASPVNLTWAANNSSYFRDKGIDGFLLRGILEYWAALPDAPEGEEPLHDWQPLIEELRLARTRLEEEGGNRFFLHLDAAPEAPWFLDPHRRDAVTKVFATAGNICQRSGLTGLALDLRASPFLFFPQWDGYPLDASLRAAAGARELARRAMRDFYGSCPDGELVVLCPPLASAGPLMFDFIAGLCESVGAAEALRQYYIFPQRAALQTPIQRSQIDQFLQQRVGTPWQSTGHIGFSAQPLARDEGGVVNLMTAPDFARAKAYLQVYSDGYTLINDPMAAWWSVPEDQVAQYQHLHQAGDARIVARREAPAWAEGWTGRLPFEGFQRIGPLDRDEGAGIVFSSELGSAVFFPAGTRSSIRLEGRVQPVYVSRAETGFTQRDVAPSRDGVVELPTFDQPVLVDGLPVRDWLLPACFFFEVDTPFRARGGSGDGSLRKLATFGLNNASTLSLEGRLEVVAGPGFSVGPATFDINLAPGETVHFERYVQGVPHLGETARFDLVWLTALGAEAVRSFAFPVRPAAHLEQPLDGPGDIPPVLLGEQLLVGSAYGDVQSLDPAWSYLHRFAALVALQAVDLEPAHTGVAMLDTDGRVRTLNARGDVQAAFRIPELEDAQALMGTPTQDAFRYLVAAQDGTVVATDRKGAEAWRLPGPAIATGRGEGAGFLRLPEGETLHYVRGPRGFIRRLGASGAEAWIHPLQVSASPVLSDEAGNTVIIGMADGQLITIALGSGRLTGIIAQVDGRVRWIMPLTLDELLVGTEDRIMRLDALGQVVWAAAARQPTAPDITSFAGVEMLAYGVGGENVPGGVVTCNARTGEEWWRDLGHAAGVGVAPRWMLWNPDPYPDLVVCGLDRRLQILDLRQAWRALLEPESN